MDAAFFARSVTAVHEAFARGLGCPPEAFATERLTIVERPDPPAWSFTALVATFGTGTVLSIDPTFSAFIHAHAPTRHVRAMEPKFLQVLIAEGARRGAVLQTTAPGPGFTLSAPPGRVKPPPGYGLTLVDATWMAEEMSSHRFENGVGEPGVGGRAFRNQFAAVLLDPTDVPVAVAGVFLTYGLFEIGVDVIWGQRGKGLTPLVVQAAAAEIVARGEAAFYSCAATNTRSQRTALAAGFLPVCADAAVFAESGS